ncbi:MAG: putative PDDEXK endonuclease [Ferrimicrobium sp.]
MSNPSKAKGSLFERHVAQFLGLMLGTPVHRIASAGSNDRGDLAIEGIEMVVECKAANAIKLGEWMKELSAECANARTRRGVLVVKRRMAGVQDAYAVMSLAAWAQLVKAAKEGYHD